MFEPCYLSLSRTGELEQRAAELESILNDCTLCPHECNVNRTLGETGICNSPAKLIISSVFPHFGEEPPLVGMRGSGTVFLTYCNTQCVFCQNYTISHLGEGRAIPEAELAEAMLELQNIGCHNINFVTPTHYVPQITRALSIAAERGLCLPLVYNTSGYDSVKTLKILDGIIDIYMPDTKFSENKTGEKYTQAADYPDRMFSALQEMHRQAGDLVINSSGIAERGMLIRHLVMPNNLAGTSAVMEFIAEKLSRDSYVNIMAQYRPCYRAGEFPELMQSITWNDMKAAYSAAKNVGLHRGF
ncbi:radical SAM protein [bacterium SM23_31]|nr:MAG: radical SAM protein [bacterium SM23_31]